MSLSFVSKSVQTATETGGFEEKPIEPKDGTGSSREGYPVDAKPLFEQLRANQAQDEAEREEQERAIMRGTVELNEEDCAHLDALDRKKQEEEAEKHRTTQEALAAFRAAQADKLDASGAGEVTNTERSSRERAPPATTNDATVPLVLIRRKRRREEGFNAAKEVEEESRKTISLAQQKEVSGVSESDVQKKTDTRLGGLLTGYGSSDDEDS